jgi:DNA-binding MarR family transcriptional regulator
MDSVFDPEKQHKRVDSKIVAALERLNQAFRTQLWNQAQEHGLSPIQIQILVFLLNHDRSMSRVSRLAREFGVTAATVSDAVSTLVEKNLAERVASRGDLRVFDIRLTQQGRRLTRRLSGWADSMRDSLGVLSAKQQQAVMHSLMQMISSLQQSGIVSEARMCVSCRHFVEKPHSGSAQHYCLLLEKSLDTGDLRIDCPEHVPIH